MDLSPENIRWIIQGMIILILSIAVHEYGHALIADKLGDRLPGSQGRVTLNPLAHADPIGTLAFPLFGFLFAGGAMFGWGKPVMVNPISFSRRWRMRTAHMMVAAAGPMMNVLFGTVIAIVHLTLLKTGVITLGDHLHVALTYASLLNFILAFFNLVPAPPLDGGTVLEGLLPDKYLPAYHRYAVYGPFVLMGIILIPGAYRIVLVPAQWLQDHVYGLLAAIGLS